MRILNCKNFDELLGKRNPDAPQLIVAGWFTPNMEPIGATVTACNKATNVGQLAVSMASCLSACFKQIQQLVDDHPGLSDQIFTLVQHMTGSLEVVARFKNDLAGPAALAACKADEPIDEDKPIDRLF